ncbi:MAG: hypothetical protein ACE15D_02000 [Candidatus Eisenbacteria bacterium]|nr:hypothetical protein [Candidatus Eisenbacteria bacterium]
MVSTRIVLISDSVRLAGRLRAALRHEGYTTMVHGFAGHPNLILLRSCPDLLILHASRDAAHLERWRQGVEATRRRRSLPVLGIAPRHMGGRERSILEGIADLGVCRRPVRKREILERIDPWSTSGARLLRAS